MGDDERLSQLILNWQKVGSSVIVIISPGWIKVLVFKTHLPISQTSGILLLARQLKGT
jgi:hypothetical protein